MKNETKLIRLVGIFTFRFLLKRGPLSINGIFRHFQAVFAFEHKFFVKKKAFESVLRTHRRLFFEMQLYKTNDFFVHLTPYIFIHQLPF
jgi:hypothetical protein